MFYTIIRVNLNFDITKFEEIGISKLENKCSLITIVDSVKQLKESALKLIPKPSSTFIACVIENKKSPLRIVQYTDPNNLLGNINFTWTDCTETLILPVKSQSIKEELYTKTHWALNKTTSKFYGKSSKDHSSEITDNLVLRECLETGYDFCSGDILYQDLKYFHQPRIFDCADASMKMLIDYHMLKCDELKYDMFFEQRKELKFSYDSRTIKLSSGKNVTELKSYSGFLNTKNVKDSVDPVLPGHLTYFLYRYGPIIVRTNEIGGHFLIVKGVIDNRILTDDPWTGSNILVKFDEFNKKWDGTILYFSAGYSKYIEETNEQKNGRGPDL